MVFTGSRRDRDLRSHALGLFIALVAVATSSCGAGDDASGKPIPPDAATDLDAEKVSTDTALGWPERFCKLRERMTREEVRSLMGEPTAEYLDASPQDQYQAYQFRITIFYSAPRAQDPDQMKVRVESLEPEVTGSLTELTPQDLDLFPCASEAFDPDTLEAIYANGPTTSLPTFPFVTDVRAAVDAVEAHLGTGQQYFEITASAQLTNVFVAVDESTAAVPFVYDDGALEPPQPTLTGASGFTFTADAIDFDEDAILMTVLGELPDATIDSLSVEGAEGGTVRYVVSARSRNGGSLEVTVAADGKVLSVVPV